MRYDSTYSALIALNKALGGDENKIPDSEYSAVVDLMSTLSGEPVEAADFWNSLSPEVGDTIEFIARPNHTSGPLDLSNGEILNEGEMMFIAGCTPSTPYAIYINLEKKTE